MVMTKIFEAQYIKGEIKEYEGNPLINALPPINSIQETARLLNRYPVVTDEERALPAHIRRHAMMRILDKFLYPTKMHLQLEQMISSMIRRGYLNRNISNAEYQENLNKVDETDFVQVSRNAGSEALSSSVIGCSGSGKTTATEAILAGYSKQAIYHPEYQHTQLAWLKLDCPHDGSAKSLCIHFFREVDRILGTDYEDTYVKSRSSAENMLGSIARVSALHSLGILVIDEIQHLKAAKSGGAQTLLNFFVTMTNVIKVPVLFIGTPNAIALFSGTMRSARRASQFGSLDWNRFEQSVHHDGKSDWDKFIGRLWKLQWLKTPVPLHDEVKVLLWELTQGVAHIAVTLFFLSQARAVMSGREVIDVKLLKKTFDDEFEMVRPMIEALKSNRPEQIVKYSDLDLPKSSFRAIAMQDAIETTFSEKQTTKVDEREAAFKSMLSQAGIGEDLVDLVALQAIQDNPDANFFELMGYVSQMQSNFKPKEGDEGNSVKPASKKASKPKVKSRETQYEQDDLRLLDGQSSEQIYQYLQQVGCVLNVSDFIGLEKLA